MTFNFSKTLSVDSKLRKELGGPFGRLVKDSELERKVKKGEVIYAVGDVTVAVLLKHGYRPKLAIFDFRTERNFGSFPIIRKTYKNPLRLRNRAGSISVALWNAVKRMARARSKSAIRVSGEEDMASIVCTHFAKEGDIVMYGLRNKGMAVIRVDKRIKRYVLGVLKRMSSSR